LFVPRPPLEWREPINRTDKGTPSTLTGVAGLLSQLEMTAPPPIPPRMDPASVSTRTRQAKARALASAIEGSKASWDPASDSKATEDAFSTLFVARLAHATTEDGLAKAFGEYGRIVSLRIVVSTALCVCVLPPPVKANPFPPQRDGAGASRGYAFIQYKEEEDVKKAYRRGEGLVLDGHRLVLDVERGRTVRGWVPRRLGGGLGNSRASKMSVKRDKKAGRIYHQVGAFSVIVPASLEATTNQEAVKRRHMQLADMKVREREEAIRAAARGGAPAGAPSAGAAGAYGRGPPPSSDAGHSRGGVGLGYGGRAGGGDRGPPPPSYDRGREGGYDRDGGRGAGGYGDRDRERDRRERSGRREEGRRSRSRERDRRAPDDRDRDRERDRDRPLSRDRDRGRY